MKLSNIWRRVKRKTPEFFIKTRKFGFLLTGISGALLAVPGLNIPVGLAIVLGHVVTIGATVVAVSSVAVKSDENTTI